MEQTKHLVEDLETLNEIATTLNQAVDVRSALERALAHLIDLMGVETGWIFVRDKDAREKWWGSGFTLVAHHNLPPALALDNPLAWKKGCDCQSLCVKGELTEAYNEVRCSRLATVSGERHGLTVHASTPLRSGQKTLGILNIAAPNWDTFSPRALSLLGNVGQQIGIALERARLYDLLHERRVHEQASLLDFSNQLLGRLDLDDLMAYLVEEVRALLQVDACALLLPDDAAPGYLRFCAASGWRSDPVGEQRQVPADDRTGSGKVMRTQEPMIVENLKRREATPWMADWLPKEKFKSAAIVPLVAEGQSIGTLVVDSRRPRRLEEHEIRLLQLMANQAAIALEKARLHREEIRRHRLEEELSVARQIQLSMLPATLPAVAGWEFATYYEAARQVGGDFYDFFELPPAAGNDAKRLALVIADVTDKGVPAALFMALSRTTIRNVAISPRDPAAALEKANKLIYEDSQTDLFLTAFYAAVETDTGCLTYVNAGHNPPLLYRAGASEFQQLTADGIALGVLSDITLQEKEIEVAPDDLLIFYTDGVTEAMDEDLQEFGLDRLQGAITSASGVSAEELVQAIVTAVNDYTDNMPKWDDFTLVVARRLPVS
jgi:sigma-B regulation protein RsbU (phosphoserine phosphatase)